MDHLAPVKLQYDFKTIGIVILGVTFWIFFIIFIGIPVLVPLALWKVLVVLPLAKKFHPDLVAISRIDELVVFHESRTNPVTNPCQVWKLRGCLNVEKFREHFHKCFLSSEEDRRQHENLFCYFAQFLGYLFKKRIAHEELELSEHIREISEDELGLVYFQSGVTGDGMKGDANANTKSGRMDLDAFIGKWMASCTYPRNKPAWEILLIHLNEGTTTVCFKIDHGLCDGYSFVHLVDKLSGSESPYMFPKKNALSLKKKVEMFVQAPFLCFWSLWGRMCWDKGLFDPKTLQNPEWFASFSSVDLDLVKAIRKKTNTHFVTVLMSVLSGAIRSHVLESEDEESLPEFLHMGHSLGWPNHPAMSTSSSKKLTNHLTMASYAVPLKDESCLERLLVCEEEFNEYERLHGPEIFNYIVLLLFSVLPGSCKRLLLKLNLGFLRFTCFFSSLILTPKPISLMGVPVKQLTLPLVLPSVLQACSMYAVTTTHSGQLELSINASSEIFRNQEELNRFTQYVMPKELRRLGKCLDVGMGQGD